MAKDKVKKSIFKRWWFWVVAIIVLFAIFSGGDDDNEAASNSSDNESNVEEVDAENVQEENKENNAEENNTQENNAEENKKDDDDTNENEEDEDVEVVKIGEPAEIADVIFTVTNVEETEEIASGNEFIDNATTSGKFLLVDITVENNKNDSITIDSSFFKVITDDEKEYKVSNDGDVMMALGDKWTDFFLKDINPGLSKEGQVVFEVAGDIDVSKTKLHAQTGFWGTETVEVLLSK